MIVRVACPGCGDMFVADERGHALWCSDACRKRAERRREGVMGARTATCPCGAEVITVGGGRLGLYCSPACKQRAYRERRRG